MNTNNQKLYERNLISTLEGCLKEHQVELSGSQESIPRYLIEVQVQSSLFQDFLDTYQNDVDKFKKDLAQKTFGKKSGMQTYGVLVDTGLQYDFAFNRKFADINRKDKRIQFKSAEEVLLKAKPTEYTPPSFPKKYPSGGNSWPFHNDVIIRYSLVGEQGQGNFQDGTVNYDKASLLKNVKKSYADDKIKLKLEDGKSHDMFLINTSYQTKTLNDFLYTFKSELDEFKIKLGEKQFGESKSYNSYGLVFDENLKMLFAFNNQFARYNKDAQSIEYYPVEEVLLGNNKNDNKKMDFSQIKRDIVDIVSIVVSDMSLPRIRIPRRSSGRGGSTTFRYSLQGKSEEN